MKKLLTIFLLLLLFPTASVTAESPELTLSPEKILTRVDTIRAPGSDFIFTVTADVNNGEVMSEYTVKVNNSTKSLVLYTKSVKNKGRVILLDDRNMWIYIPGTSRAMRISPQQQLVGAASNADISRVVFNIDYRPLSAVTKKEHAREVIELELQAKEASAPYRKVVLIVDKHSFQPIKADFYALSGKKLKSIDYLEYAPVLGEVRPVKLVISDSVNTSKTTTLTYSHFSLEKTPEAFYQPSYLNRVR
ncbi:TPA: outer membrane lipoprotein-sorting protein [Escherichia coli]|nr:outer membrane lipoprotein-sorting protein [Escherichia coli]